MGDEDEATSLLAREGFEIPKSGAGPVERYRHADGWEVRIIYATARRNRDRANAKARHERGEACEG